MIPVFCLEIWTNSLQLSAEESKNKQNSAKRGRGTDLEETEVSQVR